jgi:hypothetical protein
MADYVIPTVGSSGYFQLREPFQEKIQANVKYTCQAVRRFSDYVANNEDIKTDIYDEFGISEDIYEEDMRNNTDIVSLQAETGQWLYVPVRYVIGFPSTNGIPYRAISFAVALPAMPADRDYSHVITDIGNLIQQSLGVNTKIDIIETSKVTLVDSAKHETKQAERQAVAGAVSTDRGRYMKALQDLQQANQKIAALEAWIKVNKP